MLLKKVICWSLCRWEDGHKFTVGWHLWQWETQGTWFLLTNLDKALLSSGASLLETYCPHCRLLSHSPWSHHPKHLQAKKESARMEGIHNLRDKFAISNPSISRSWPCECKHEEDWWMWKLAIVIIIAMQICTMLLVPSWLMNRFLVHALTVGTINSIQFHKSSWMLQTENWSWFITQSGYSLQPAMVSLH